MSVMAAVISFFMRNQTTHCSWKRVVFIVLTLLAGVGCGHSPTNVKPSIQFTRIPPVNPGGPLTMGSISGRISGPHDGLKLVLYAKSGRWYVQPYTERPFITIKPDSSWESPTHLGTDYAALLVQSDYAPPAVIDNLPSVGGGITALEVTEGTPPVWQRGWFRLLVGLLVTAAIVGFYQWRMRELARQLNLRFEERLAERTRIAQELHDTLLQGLLSISMQIHVAADQLPGDAPAHVTLDRAKQLMGQVIEEGRNTIRGLRSSIQNPDDLIATFSQIPRQLGETEVALRLVVEGEPTPLLPEIRDNVYCIGREALINAFRHSRASRINLHLEYATNHLRILVQDNGCGIDAQIVNAERDGYSGLSGMRRRAERIGAHLRLMSRVGIGTEVELRVPAEIAFESAPPSTSLKWLARFQNQPGETELTAK
jgi:signal transduction histidine kinase